MRRGFSISLVLLFLLAPLISWLPGAAESSLPMCCRRHGDHRCAQSATASSTTAVPHSLAAPARCPLYAASAPATLAAFLLPASMEIASPLGEIALSLPAIQARGASTRAASDRGPPSAS